MKAKNLFAGLAIVSLLLLGGSAFAEPNAIDSVPAATLLLPYFEVDLSDPLGTTTLFSVNNASAAPTVAHVTIWSDLTVPVLDWNVFLTGYDVHPVNLRDVLNGDLVPATLHDRLDGPADTVSPHGANPQWDSGAAFPACDTQLPLGANALDATFVSYVQNALTGNATPLPGDVVPLCFGVPRGNNTAVGYVTIDNVTDCTLLFPSQPGYFGSGIPSTVNQLWGDYSIIDANNAFAMGEPLVSVEYDEMYAPGDYTFYGRYVTFDASDGREPLANAWGTRYLNGGAFSGGTDLLVWRDSKTNPQPFACNTFPPAPFPLNETQVIAFDEEETPRRLCDIGGGNVSPPINNDPTCFPWETQRVSLNDPASPVFPPFTFGWMYINLDHTVSGGDPFGGPEAQAHVTEVHSALGLYQVGYQATILNHVSDGPAPLITGNGFDG